MDFSDLRRFTKQAAQKRARNTNNAKTDHSKPRELSQKLKSIKSKYLRTNEKNNSKPKKSSKPRAQHKSPPTKHSGGQNQHKKAQNQPKNPQTKLHFFTQIMSKKQVRKLVGKAKENDYVFYKINTLPNSKPFIAIPEFEKNDEILKEILLTFFNGTVMTIIEKVSKAKMDKFMNPVKWHLEVSRSIKWLSKILTIINDKYLNLLMYKFSFLEMKSHFSDFLFESNLYRNKVLRYFSEILLNQGEYGKARVRAAQLRDPSSSLENKENGDFLDSSYEDDLTLMRFAEANEAICQEEGLSFSPLEACLRRMLVDKGVEKMLMFLISKLINDLKIGMNVYLSDHSEAKKRKLKYFDCVSRKNNAKEELIFVVLKKLSGLSLFFGVKNTDLQLGRAKQGGKGSSMERYRSDLQLGNQPEASFDRLESQRTTDFYQSRNAFRTVQNDARELNVLAGRGNGFSYAENVRNLIGSAKKCQKKFGKERYLSLLSKKGREGTRSKERRMGSKEHQKSTDSKYKSFLRNKKFKGKSFKNLARLTSKSRRNITETLENLRSIKARKSKEAISVTKFGASGLSRPRQRDKTHQKEHSNAQKEFKEAQKHSYSSKNGLKSKYTKSQNRVFKQGSKWGISSAKTPNNLSANRLLAPSRKTATFNTSVREPAQKSKRKHNFSCLHDLSKVSFQASIESLTNLGRPKRNKSESNINKKLNIDLSKIDILTSQEKGFEGVLAGQIYDSPHSDAKRGSEGRFDFGKTGMMKLKIQSEFDEIIKINRDKLQSNVLSSVRSGKKEQMAAETTKEERDEVAGRRETLGRPQIALFGVSSPKNSNSKQIGNFDATGDSGVVGASEGVNYSTETSGEAGLAGSRSNSKVRICFRSLNQRDIFDKISPASDKIELKEGKSDLFTQSAQEIGFDLGSRSEFSNFLKDAGRRGLEGAEAVGEGLDVHGEEQEVLVPEFDRFVAEKRSSSKARVQLNLQKLETSKHVEQESGPSTNASKRAHLIPRTSNDHSAAFQKTTIGSSSNYASRANGISTAKNSRGTEPDLTITAQSHKNLHKHHQQRHRNPSVTVTRPSVSHKKQQRHSEARKSQKQEKPQNQLDSLMMRATNHEDNTDTARQPSSSSCDDNSNTINNKLSSNRESTENHKISESESTEDNNRTQTQTTTKPNSIKGSSAMNSSFFGFIEKVEGLLDIFNLGTIQISSNLKLRKPAPRQHAVIPQSPPPNTKRPQRTKRGNNEDSAKKVIRGSSRKINFASKRGLNSSSRPTSTKRAKRKPRRHTEQSRRGAAIPPSAKQINRFKSKRGVQQHSASSLEFRKRGGFHTSSKRFRDISTTLKDNSRGRNRSIDTGYPSKLFLRRGPSHLKSYDENFMQKFFEKNAKKNLRQNSRGNILITNEVANISKISTGSYVAHHNLGSAAVHELNGGRPSTGFINCCGTGQAPGPGPSPTGGFYTVFSKHMNSTSPLAQTLRGAGGYMDIRIKQRRDTGYNF